MKSNTNAKYLENVKFLMQTGTVRQIMFMVGIAISVAVGIVLYMSVQEPIYRPLDYQVTSQNMATLTDTLEKAGIQYKINDRDNVIYVAAKDLQVAKMKLAAAGVPKDDSFNYSFLNEQGSYGNSQFVENARYLRALESDLSKTIGAIEGVGSASVHIAIPQNSVFADESGKVTASVVLNISPGFASDKEKIRSIMQIIAGSVAGLDPKNVSITDQYGHLLSDGLDQDSIYNSAQLNYQNNIQTYYEKRIQSLIVPMTGENKVSVRVFADIDFTQHEETQEQYDPDKKAVRSEETSSESADTSGGASGAPGSLANTPPTDSDAQKASSSGGGGSQGKNQSIKNYELGKSVSYRKSNAAKIKRLSVAVIVDNEMVLDPKTKQYATKPMDQDKIAKITQLVQATIGYDQARGDKVTVVNSGFIPVKADAPLPPLHVWDQPWFWDTMKKTMGILFGFIFLGLIYRRLSNFSKSTPVIRHKEAAQQAAEKIEMIDNRQEADALKQQRLNQLKQLASTEPTRVAQVIKNWVGKQ